MKWVKKAWRGYWELWDRPHQVGRFDWFMALALLFVASMTAAQMWWPAFWIMWFCGVPLQGWVLRKFLAYLSKPHEPSDPPLADARASAD